MSRSCPREHNSPRRPCNHAALNYESLYNIFGIVVPNGNAQDLKVVEGLNEAGLNFSILAFSNTHGPDDGYGEDVPVLSAIDLGMWMLARFSTVAEVKAAARGAADPR